MINRSSRPSQRTPLQEIILVALEHAPAGHLFDNKNSLNTPTLQEPEGLFIYYVNREQSHRTEIQITQVRPNNRIAQLPLVIMSYTLPPIEAYYQRYCKQHVPVLGRQV